MHKEIITVLLSTAIVQVAPLQTPAIVDSRPAMKVSQAVQAIEKKLPAPQAEVAPKDVPVAPAASTGPVGNVEQIVRDAAIRYGQNPDYMVKIAMCESTLNPNSVARNIIDGGHPSGLFQHVTTYWPARAAKYGYPGASVFDAVANANVTAQMFRDGHQNLWECH